MLHFWANNWTTGDIYIYIYIYILNVQALCFAYRPSQWNIQDGFRKINCGLTPQLWVALAATHYSPCDTVWRVKAWGPLKKSSTTRMLYDRALDTQRAGSLVGLHHRQGTYISSPVAHWYTMTYTTTKLPARWVSSARS